jgi:hypothetical protein
MATDEEKSTMEYGLRVAKAVEGEWFKRKANTCRFYDQWGEFHRLRLYARGEQPIQKYKDELSTNGDMSMLNLDWTPIPIIPKFVDIVVNGMNDRLFTIKAESQDVMSAEKKNIFQDMIEGDMIAKDFLQLTKDQFGIDAFNVDPNDLPENDDDPVDQSFKLPSLLKKEGILFSIQNAGDMEAMNARNLPFQAGTATAYRETHAGY